MAGSLDQDKQREPRLAARVDKLTNTTGPTIKDEVEAILDKGWNLIAIHDISGNTFAFYTRPKRQND
jgi:hypothetical protein